VSEDQIKKFLIEIQTNKNLRDQVLSVATANEIAKIANYAGFLSCLKIGTNSIKNKDFNGL